MTGSIVGPAAELAHDGVSHRRVPMPKEEGAMPDPVVDQLVAIDIPFPRPLGAIHIDGERREVADVV
jgi:hypothetical protein